MAEEERFSLKDHLFNKEQVKKISRELKAAYPAFKSMQFEKKVLAEFPKLELTERINWIREQLKAHLPDDYQKTVNILLRSLPSPCDPTKSDNDFGEFIYAPYGDFVSTYGLEKKDLNFSLAALKELTTRFSVEGPIRYFINTHPKETFRELVKWTKDSHYHVRRAASEGTRPSLPWAKKITTPYQDAVSLLDALYADKTRFVTRSVANHVNDIGKIDPKAAISLLKRWKKGGKQTEKEMAYIMSHALRTLIKDGNTEALQLLGYDGKHIDIKNFSIKTPKVSIGDALEFSFDVVSTSTEPQDIMIDYILYFNKANGTLAPKTHKIAKKKLKGKETLHIIKKHPFRIMTTRKLYPGHHEVELQINGTRFGKKAFVLEK